MSSILSAAHFHNEEAAYNFVEARIWREGPVCPHCGATKEHVGKLNGKSTRVGVHKCYACRKPFTVKVGTIFESSHCKLHIWLQAMHFMASSKKGVSANQLHRILGVSLQTAWFLAHRVREAMRSGDLAPMGGAGGIVEADETFIGRKEGSIKRRGHGHKNAVLSLVARKSKQVRSFHIDGTSAADVMPIIRKNVAKETAMMTDEGGHYSRLGADFASHESVQHKADEYVRGDVHTNTVEGYFSIFKRGMKGIYQHCSEKHLHRYVAEFDFRYNQRIALGIDDETRTAKIIGNVVGRRLTYQTANRKVTENGQAPQA